MGSGSSPWAVTVDRERGPWAVGRDRDRDRDRGGGAPDGSRDYRWEGRVVARFLEAVGRWPRHLSP